MKSGPDFISDPHMSPPEKASEFALVPPAARSARKTRAFHTDQRQNHGSFEPLIGANRRGIKARPASKIELRDSRRSAQISVPKNRPFSPSAPRIIHRKNTRPAHDIPTAPHDDPAHRNPRFRIVRESVVAHFLHHFKLARLLALFFRDSFVNVGGHGKSSCSLTFCRGKARPGLSFPQQRYPRRMQS